MCVFLCFFVVALWLAYVLQNIVLWCSCGSHGFKSGPLCVPVHLSSFSVIFLLSLLIKMAKLKKRGNSFLPRWRKLEQQRSNKNQYEAICVTLSLDTWAELIKKLKNEILLGVEQSCCQVMFLQLSREEQRFALKHVWSVGVGGEMKTTIL